MSGVFAGVQNGPENLGPTEPTPRLNAALLTVGVPTAGFFFFYNTVIILLHIRHKEPLSHSFPEHSACQKEHHLLLILFSMAGRFFDYCGGGGGGSVTEALLQFTHFPYANNSNCKLNTKHIFYCRKHSYLDFFFCILLCFSCEIES